MTDKYHEMLKLVEIALKPLKDIGYTDICVNEDDFTYLTARTEWDAEKNGEAVMHEISVEGSTKNITECFYIRHGLRNISVVTKQYDIVYEKHKRAIEEYLQFLDDNNVIAPPLSYEYQ